MKLSWLVRPGLVGGLVIAALVPRPATAAEWAAAAGDMGRDASRFAFHIGGSWGAVNGTEVSKLDPATGFEGGVSVRVFRSVSVYGGYASSSSKVSGQLVQLLDQPMRSDGRSGTVEGDVTFRRFRTGVRIDGLRQERWPVRAYILGAAIFTTNEVKLSSVDHREPGMLPAPGGGFVDLRKFDDTQTGFLGRVGAEYRVAPHVGVDLGFTYEVFEAPPGTNSTTCVSGGFTFRI